ncbi:MAG: amino acid transport protein [Gammaproteobacteria bacterium]|nr:amino acid transport protein [Gammaproteobacteria bacterium]MDE1887372.1 amino acid transport protein [Gammaproteobacteria bacterium]MDE2024321.1 amino acid transport protein [Gammaproteobacteria bacterium]MDE2140433.1 amino acid transport protein [Gammaproteobacteria bacterium]MDE2272663.1 amino acid transport protein [Gammaproteobacteria bacterium]
MKFSVTSLLAGLIFSSIGTGYFIYGRRQGRVAYLICGAALAVFSWFVSNLMGLLGIGLLLVLAPFAAAYWLDL